MTSVCVYDIQTDEGYWAADYYPASGVTKFSGRWWMIPDLPSKQKPSDNDIEVWAEKFKKRELYLWYCLLGGLFNAPENKLTGGVRSGALKRAKSRYEKKLKDNGYYQL